MKKINYQSSVIVLGPIAAFLVYLLSAKIVYEARIMLSILVLTVIWWIFSKIPLAITALFSTTLMIVFGVASAGKVTVHQSGNFMEFLL